MAVFETNQGLLRGRPCVNKSWNEQASWLGQCEVRPALFYVNRHYNYLLFTNLSQIKEIHSVVFKIAISIDNCLQMYVSQIKQNGLIVF